MPCTCHATPTPPAPARRPAWVGNTVEQNPGARSTKATVLRAQERGQTAGEDTGEAAPRRPTDRGRCSRRLQKPSRAPLSWLVGHGELLEAAECFWRAISPGSERGLAREPAAGGPGANLSVTQSPRGNRTLCQAGGMRQLFTAPSSSIFHSLSICPAPPSTHTASPLAFRSLPHFQSRFLSPWKSGFKSVWVTFPYLLPLLTPS